VIVTFHTGLTVEVPSSWDQIRTPEHYLIVVQELMKLRRGEGNLDGFCMNLVKRLLNIHLKEEPKGIVAENLFRMAEQMAGYFYQEHGKLIPAMNFTTNFIPRVGKRYGPSELLLDMTWGEFMDALRFVQQDDDALCSALYRRKVKGERVAYDNQKITPLKASQEVKDGIRIWFEANLNYIATQDMEISGNTVNFAPLFTHGKGKGIGMLGVTYALAASGVFGDVDKVATRNLYEVLLRLYQLKMEETKNDTVPEL